MKIPYRSKRFAKSLASTKSLTLYIVKDTMMLEVTYHPKIWERSESILPISRQLSEVLKLAYSFLVQWREKDISRRLSTTKTFLFDWVSFFITPLHIQELIIDYGGSLQHIDSRVLDVFSSPLQVPTWYHIEELHCGINFNMVSKPIKIM